MNWISMKERQPKDGAKIIISLWGGTLGVWRDKLWPDQAGFRCGCDEETIDVEDIDYWMGITLPKIPKDK